MKKEKTVRTYQRRTKSGKVVTVRQHKAKYDAADALKKSLAKKEGAGEELKSRKDEMELAKELPFTLEEYKEWYNWDAENDPDNPVAKKVEKELIKSMGKKGYNKYFDELTDNYSPRGANKAFKSLLEVKPIESSKPLKRSEPSEPTAHQSADEKVVTAEYMRGTKKEQITLVGKPMVYDGVISQIGKRADGTYEIYQSQDGGKSWDHAEGWSDGIDDNPKNFYKYNDDAKLIKENGFKVAKEKGRVKLVVDQKAAQIREYQQKWNALIDGMSDSALSSTLSEDGTVDNWDTYDKKKYPHLRRYLEAVNNGKKAKITQGVRDDLKKEMTSEGFGGDITLDIVSSTYNSIPAATKEQEAKLKALGLTGSSGSIWRTPGETYRLYTQKGIADFLSKFGHLTPEEIKKLPLSKLMSKRKGVEYDEAGVQKVLAAAQARIDKAAKNATTPSKKSSTYEVLGVDLSHMSDKQFKEFAGSHVAYDSKGRAIQAPTTRAGFKKFVEKYYTGSEASSNFREGYKEFWSGETKSAKGGYGSAPKTKAASTDHGNSKKNAASAASEGTITREQASAIGGKPKSKKSAAKSTEYHADWELVEGVKPTRHNNLDNVKGWKKYVSDLKASLKRVKDPEVIAKVNDWIVKGEKKIKSYK